MIPLNFLLPSSLLLSVLTLNAETFIWQKTSGIWKTKNTPNTGWSDVSSPSLSADDHIVIRKGNLAYQAETLGDMGKGWQACNLTLSGGSLVQTTTHWVVFNGSGRFQITGGNYTSSADRILFGENSTDNASFLITAGSLTHLGKQIAVRGNNRFEIKGGEVSTNSLHLGEFGHAVVDISAGSIRLIDGANGHAISRATSGSAINITEQGIVQINNISVEQAIAYYLDTDLVLAGMDTNNHLLQVVDDDQGGVKISLYIPPAPHGAVLGIGTFTVAIQSKH